MGLVPVPPRRASRSSRPADGIAGGIHSHVVDAWAGRRSGTNTHLLLAINLKESRARCPNRTPVGLGIHEGFWRSPKEHPVAPLAGAVNPRWARGDSMNVVVGFDTRFEAWRECDSRSSQPAAPLRWPWTDESGVKYSRGYFFWGCSPPCDGDLYRRCERSGSRFGRRAMRSRSRCRIASEMGNACANRRKFLTTPPIPTERI